ncbi:hypothetical protein PR048_005436 [Dryococelus australis]|uniref:HAT C-terminal dimerisation domain-containing protein n=1 Tax=Dryococelus australis TaxID=614101 RepID=A0ABQ9I9D0_9NEOP|nr:hypothetical protein PR048_005436 [Dryococelus australis]
MDAAGLRENSTNANFFPRDVIRDGGRLSSGSQPQALGGERTLAPSLLVSAKVASLWGLLAISCYSVRLPAGGGFGVWTQPSFYGSVVVVVVGQMSLWAVDTATIFLVSGSALSTILLVSSLAPILLGNATFKMADRIDRGGSSDSAISSSSLSQTPHCGVIGGLQDHEGKTGVFERKMGNFSVKRVKSEGKRKIFCEFGSFLIGRRPVTRLNRSLNATKHVTHTFAMQALGRSAWNETEVRKLWCFVMNPHARGLTSPYTHFFPSLVPESDYVNPLTFLPGGFGCRTHSERSIRREGGSEGGDGEMTSRCGACASLYERLSPIVMKRPGQCAAGLRAGREPDVRSAGSRFDAEVGVPQVAGGTPCCREMLWSASVPGTALNPECYRGLLSVVASERAGALPPAAPRRHDAPRRRGLLLPCPCTGVQHAKPARPKTQWYVKESIDVVCAQFSLEDAVILMTDILIIVPFVMWVRGRVYTLPVARTKRASREGQLLEASYFPRVNRPGELFAWSDYKNRDDRNGAYESMAREMAMPNFTAKEVPKKIKKHAVYLLSGSNENVEEQIKWSRSSGCLYASNEMVRRDGRNHENEAKNQLRVLEKVSCTGILHHQHYDQKSVHQLLYGFTFSIFRTFKEGKNRENGEKSHVHCWTVQFPPIVIDLTCKVQQNYGDIACIVRRSGRAAPALMKCEEILFPNLHILLKILATLPVTTASVEITFSTQERLKTYLRNSTGEDRLNGLALMSELRHVLTLGALAVDYLTPPIYHHREATPSARGRYRPRPLSSHTVIIIKSRIAPAACFPMQNSPGFAVIPQPPA